MASSTNQKKKIADLKQNHFSVDILRDKDKTDDDEMTEYLIRVNYQEGKRWNVWHSFIEFENLHLTFVKTYATCPILPSKSLMKMSENEKTARLKRLDMYLKVRLLT